MSAELLREKLESLCGVLAGIDLTADGVLAQVNEKCPVDGSALSEIRDLAVKGFEDGWLTGRTAGDIRFGRVFKPSEASSQFSCDAVYMPSCPGPRHQHPKGELDLCVAMGGAPRFDGQEPGWVFLAPGTTHVPTVTGGNMLILYFLPDGAIEWK